jgi:hypothetical protein
MTVPYISHDLGRTFTQGGAVATQGDADVAVDDTGTLYVAALTGPNSDSSATLSSVSASFDQGRSFPREADLYGSSSCDREWMAARGRGTVWVIELCGNSEMLWTSTDYARTFKGPVTIADNVGIAGALRFARDGSALFPFMSVEPPLFQVTVARLAPGATAWKLSPVAALPSASVVIGTQLFPALGVDGEGTIYVAYSAPDSAGQRVYFSRSVDKGATWLPPITMSDATPGAVGAVAGQPRTPSAVFPWISAGDAGRVAVVWYQAREMAGGSDLDQGSNLATPATVWDLWMAQSSNATSSHPVFAKSVLVSAFHTGSICTEGSGCVGLLPAGPQLFDRRLLDFFTTTTDSAGRIYVAYPADTSPADITQGFSLPAETSLIVLRQSAGPRLKR